MLNKTNVIGFKKNIKTNVLIPDNEEKINQTKTLRAQLKQQKTIEKRIEDLERRIEQMERLIRD